MADGVSRRLDETKGLGNAVLPQILEIIGRAIMKHAARYHHNRPEDSK